MELELGGKRALVTGSSRGIGRAIAEALAAEGCRVALNSRSGAELAAAVGAIRGSVPAEGDVTNAEGARGVVGAARELLGGIDILVCNVGGGRSVAPGEETPAEWQRVFALNLWSATNTVEAARQSLVESSGCVVCVSSICGHEVVPGAPVTYSAAKAALHAYVRGMARPLGKCGVRINAVAPGNVLFEGSAWARKLNENREAVESMLARDVSLGRLGMPGEIAALVAWLASPRSGFATGAVWTLDGGQVRA